MEHGATRKQYREPVMTLAPWPGQASSPLAASEQRRAEEEDGGAGDEPRWRTARAGGAASGLLAGVGASSSLCWPVAVKKDEIMPGCTTSAVALPSSATTTQCPTPSACLLGAPPARTR
ncbi:hypothetical protein E2562_010146 [Oryza meyeriana var. granulata]|uniref:Uncharacterized protein n=1 Tax=Oryza meyeriana var. granulata TaxID=110450 RepID=A0A6G1EIC5_9ORYZ|nr:hypothetical protein E2562_010146 [Oryza meyeriana var. granulata]